MFSFSGMSKAKIKYIIAIAEKFDISKMRTSYLEFIFHFFSSFHLVVKQMITPGFIIVLNFPLVWRD